MYINWENTFLLLNNEKNEKMNTSFISSNHKSHKLKILIEELLTIEHVKKRHPNLYEEWFCSRYNMN